MKKKYSLLGSILTDLMAQCAMTQKEMADTLEITPPSFSQMLTGRIAIPRQRLDKILKILKPSQQVLSKIESIYVTREPITYKVYEVTKLPLQKKINDPEYILIKTKNKKPVVVPMKINNIEALIEIFRNISKL